MIQQLDLLAIFQGNRELPQDSAIPLSGMYPRKTIIEKDTCTPMFITTPFTTAKTWKQLKCSQRDEWVKKTWYKYTIEFHSVIK